MLNSITSTITLNNGVKMPRLGFGLYKIQEGTEVRSAISYAIEAGYRSFDTASFYGNEMGTGDALTQSSIPRDELFVTTKVWNSEQGYNNTLLAFEQSLKKLQLDYIDLYLIHWPVKNIYTETWRALEYLYKEKMVRAIGVCNFTIEQLKEILASGLVVPAVNQVEFHPYLYQKELLHFCRGENIQLEAWRPLVQGAVFDEPVIRSIAEKHRKTPAQVVVRWHLQLDIVVIPKSVTRERIIENADVFDFELSGQDMQEINSLHQNKRFGPDPLTFI